MRILVCDDDHEIVEALRIYLTRAGYSVICAYDGQQALDKLSQEEVHLVLLDVMMPKMDGIRTLYGIREMGNVPVIMLTAKSEGTDKVLGLELGADDYVTKPFDPTELMARVKSQLRRYTQLGAQVKKSTLYSVGALEVDDEARRVSVDGEEIKLTPMEYKILLLLIQNTGKVFTIDAIYERVWGEKAYLAENTVAVHISNIRKKIEINPSEPRYLKVVWGVGYKIDKE